MFEQFEYQVGEAFVQYFAYGDTTGLSAAEVDQLDRFLKAQPGQGHFTIGDKVGEFDTCDVTNSKTVCRELIWHWRPIVAGNVDELYKLYSRLTVGQLQLEQVVIEDHTPIIAMTEVSTGSWMKVAMTREQLNEMADSLAETFESEFDTNFYVSRELGWIWLFPEAYRKTYFWKESNHAPH